MNVMAMKDCLRSFITSESESPTVKMLGECHDPRFGGCEAMTTM